MPTISVLLVDDHVVFAEALQTRLKREPDLAPVRVATSANEAFALVQAHVPDVAVLDVTLAPDDGVELAARIRDFAGDRCRVVMMSEVRSSAVVVDALRAGARAWLPKTVSVEELLQVLRGVLRDEVWLAPALLADVVPRLLAEGRPPEPNVLDDLTVREREILHYLVAGLTRSGIAERMAVSTNTVRTHTQNVLHKLGAHSTLEAVATAMRHGVRAPAP